ncbi:MAG: DNA integrity scanning diadenylate cyclase DisA [Nanoarchaeota archaeon]
MEQTHEKEQQSPEEEQKKEVQRRIIELPETTNAGKVTEQEFVDIIRLVSPGTGFRTALEGIVKIGKGALLVIENEFTEPLIDGGFKLNCKFTPQKLMELSKMDGAIVLSRNMKKIMHANVLLTPDSRIRTNETGTRHKAAERTAKMTGALVIAVSERKNEINVYYKNLKHTLVNSNELLRKANEQVQILEKQRELFEKYKERLDRFELQNYHTLHHALRIIQKGTLIQKISGEIQKVVVELGKEGLLLKTRIRELLKGVIEETDLTIADYTKLDVKKSRTLLKSLSYEEVLDEENILKALAYESPLQQRPIKGWRILNKTLLTDAEIAHLVKEAGSLGKAINSNISYYKGILGEERANMFKEDIERLKLTHTY